MVCVCYIMVVSLRVVGVVVIRSGICLEIGIVCVAGLLLSHSAGTSLLVGFSSGRIASVGTAITADRVADRRYIDTGVSAHGP